MGKSYTRGIQKNVENLQIDMILYERRPIFYTDRDHMSAPKGHYTQEAIHQMHKIKLFPSKALQFLSVPYTHISFNGATSQGQCLFIF